MGKIIEPRFSSRRHPIVGSKMAEPAPSDSSPDTDRDFDPNVDMLVHDYDDERTMEEEEALSNASSVGSELDGLEKESEMPIEDLLALYYGGQSGPPPPSTEPQDTRSSSEEEILSNQDLTLDKEEIARDLLKIEDNDETSVNDLLDSMEMPSHTMRLLRSSSQPASSDDDSEDIDYEPQPDDDWKKSIQVGSDFQAGIPHGLCKYGDAPAYENEDRLLWDPFKLEDPEVEGYLKDVQTQTHQTSQGVQSIPQGPHVRDDEQALYLLLQCGHNVEEALRRRKMQTVPPTDPMSLWSEEECRNFENGLRQYGKDFYQIQQNKVKTRSVGELVQFYYLWKKTERHDVFANKTRLEKKKYALHPGVTDYMDRFLDEQENPAPPRDRSSSPNINSLLYGDPKRHTAEYKEHSTADLDAALDMVQKVVDTNVLALSPLKLHPPELNTVAIGATDGYNHTPSSMETGAFASVAFRPIITVADAALCAAAPVVASTATSCTTADPTAPIPLCAGPASTGSASGSNDISTDGIRPRTNPAIVDTISSEPVKKRLKTDTEWNVNNSSSVSSFSSTNTSMKLPVSVVENVSPFHTQSKKINSDSVSNTCVNKSLSSSDSPRISANDLNSVVESVISKSPPSLSAGSSHNTDKLTNVTIGISSVAASIKSEFSSVASHDSSPSVGPIPPQHTAESAVQ